MSLEDWEIILERERLLQEMEPSECCSNPGLRAILRISEDVIVLTRAAEELLLRNPGKVDLRFIIIFAPEPWKKNAWDYIFSRGPLEHELEELFKYAPFPYYGMARRFLDAE